MTVRILVSVLLTLWLTGCATAPAPTSTEGVAPEAFSAEDYRLGPGDKVKLTVYGEEDLSGEYSVDGAGQVSLPLIGEFQARGLTVRELQGSVDAALRDGYLKDPSVSAEVVAYRPFYILGEVKRPGTYAYQSGLTVLNAVATAEGFTYRANERFVYIRRAGDQEESKFPLTSTTTVRPGDTIRIGERFF
ncbi:polysaccharide biosynthesis/export family protein [Parvularcula sp. LCG005]|uniref:polysaccharide biosynthesis/export family protein n=1 Tax=Parvularcula sp. LCG005 TaxID=3078805 RepID=UPI002942E2F0|nr:polysaccharide biosynthesis/export family protein [Parvularcula sp. LCG005]WOI52892.1 polysaccharide biosynthesis/export family protein [Parvularcula sp. LCG005]